MIYKICEPSFWSVECCDHRSWFEENREVTKESEPELLTYINWLKRQFASYLDVDSTGTYYFLAEHIVNGSKIPVSVNPYDYFIEIKTLGDDGSIVSTGYIKAFDENIRHDVLAAEDSDSDSSNELLGQEGYGSD